VFSLRKNKTSYPLNGFNKIKNCKIKKPSKLRGGLQPIGPFDKLRVSGRKNE
jgi:hypothetical protein